MLDWYQIRDSVLILYKTKSKTETQFWFLTKPNPKPKLSFDSWQNQIQNRNSDLVLIKTKSGTSHFGTANPRRNRYSRKPLDWGHLGAIHLKGIWRRKSEFSEEKWLSGEKLAFPRKSGRKVSFPRESELFPGKDTFLRLSPTFPRKSDFSSSKFPPDELPLNKVWKINNKNKFSEKIQNDHSIWFLHRFSILGLQSRYFKYNTPCTHHVHSACSLLWAVLFLFCLYCSILIKGNLF